MILEFVPKEDSQVKRLLRSRDDIFDTMICKALIDAFSTHFELQKQVPVGGSQRIDAFIQTQEGRFNRIIDFVRSQRLIHYDKEKMSNPIQTGLIEKQNERFKHNSVSFCYFLSHTPF